MADRGEYVRTYAEEILDVLGEHPERPVLVHAGRRVTAGEMRDLVHRSARVLRDLGLGSGLSVTLLGGGPEFLVARWAAHLVGCRVVQVDPRLSVALQAAIVDDVDTAALIVEPRYAARAAGIAAVAPVGRVLTLGPAGIGDDLLDQATRRSAAPLRGTARPRDVCAIRYTSGSTGRPRGVCTTYAQEAALGPKRSRFGAHRLLVCTTLAHTAGRMTDRTLAAGGTAVILDDFDPAEVLATIERERITRMFLPPPLLYRLLDHPDIARRDLSSLTSLPYGACRACPRRLVEAVRKLGPILYQVYGQTEIGGITMLTADDHDPARPDRLRSVGRALPGRELAILDEDGRAVATGEVGEVCVRSSKVMRGYWKRPEETAKALRGGWLHTRDLGRLDADGYLTLVDRVEGIIRGMDGDVYTAVVERVLESHPLVRDAVVLGVPDADLVEHVHAVIVPAPGARVGVRGLRELVRAELGDVYVPTGITLTTELPLTPTGKPDRTELRRRIDRPRNPSSRTGP
ncbi:fatty acid--CoA ligase [Embleya scabrispora]|uniref:Fatty acid--CoA ligase n=1 Tax=Embleya scabrispora TaxID=159449 RepID=A0A1T3NJY5_9ACTN|nr:AMP-binding protein [Embleya scabrispora]OPC77025.1 fatty acid--CoA ligase [Embleya scabrispora]